MLGFFLCKGNFEEEFFLRRIWGCFLIFGMVSLRYQCRLGFILCKGRFEEGLFLKRYIT